MKRCKNCSGPEFPMWYSNDYCSRSCTLDRYETLWKELKELTRLLREKK